MSSSTQRMFQLKLDPITGNSEWVVIEDNDDGDESFAHNFHQPLLATTSYLDMLNDSPRNTAFRQAIQKTITKPCHVLDIGYSKIILIFNFFNKKMASLCSFCIMRFYFFNCVVLELGCFR